ncbi:MAG TPA: hypothetical protein VGN07_05995 [Steroidobacteraceae bacterium]|jgi:hypothetical protein
MEIEDNSSSDSPGVSLPSRREELRHLLAELSDEEVQYRLWVLHEDYPNYSGIDDVFHFIFDDTDLGEDAYSEIGRILRNRLEADRLQELSLVLEKMLGRLGDQDSDIFMRDTEWASVVALARSALAEMSN